MKKLLSKRSFELLQFTEIKETLPNNPQNNKSIQLEVKSQSSSDLHFPKRKLPLCGFEPVVQGHSVDKAPLRIVKILKSYANYSIQEVVHIKTNLKYLTKVYDRTCIESDEALRKSILLEIKILQELSSSDCILNLEELYFTDNELILMYEYGTTFFENDPSKSTQDIIGEHKLFESMKDLKTVLIRIATGISEINSFDVSLIKISHLNIVDTSGREKSLKNEDGDEETSNLKLSDIHKMKLFDFQSSIYSFGHEFDILKGESKPLIHFKDEKSRDQILDPMIDFERKVLSNSDAYAFGVFLVRCLSSFYPSISKIDSKKLKNLQKQNCFCLLPNDEQELLNLLLQTQPLDRLEITEVFESPFFTSILKQNQQLEDLKNKSYMKKSFKDLKLEIKEYTEEDKQETNFTPTHHRRNLKKIGSLCLSDKTKKMKTKGFGFLLGGIDSNSSPQSRFSRLQKSFREKDKYGDKKKASKESEIIDYNIELFPHCPQEIRRTPKKLNFLDHFNQYSDQKTNPSRMLFNDINAQEQLLHRDIIEKKERPNGVFAWIGSFLGCA